MFSMKRSGQPSPFRSATLASPVQARVIDDVVNECDTALLDSVDELELMEDCELAHCFQLCILPRQERIRRHVRIRKADLPGRGRLGSAAPADERSAERKPRDQALCIAEKRHALWFLIMSPPPPVHGFTSVDGATRGRMTPVPCSIAIVVPNGCDSR